MVGEAQGDVVAQLIRAQQQLHVSLIGVAIEVSRALPAEDVACAFGEDDTITCIAEPFTDFVRVDDLRVAEGDRFHTESVHQELFLQLHLFDERAFVVQRGDAVGESTAGDFHAASGDQLFETVDDFRTVILEQHDGAARDAETATEIAVCLLDEVQQHLVGRQIAAFSQTFGQILVLIIIKIVVILIDIKEAIRTETVGLTNLKVETYFIHNAKFFRKF